MDIKTTSLEPWIKRKIGGDSSGVLTRKQLEDYQLVKLKETLSWVIERSRFYQHLYSGWNCEISSFQEFEKLPFTTPEDLKEKPLDFLCVSQNNINRIVTLQTSGTTGRPKRLFFSEADQELTIDFFHYGMLTLVEPGDKVLIMLPGKTPGSVGDLLRLGLERAGVTGIVYGPVNHPEQALEMICRENINALVGIPTQVLSLARCQAQGNYAPLSLRSVLLSTDYVPRAIVQELKRTWSCKVFNHYGMTEMGLGGALECEGFGGCHLREADLYFEIIDPKSGLTVEEGQSGEVVFTTLTRTAMPLVRYRTGDISRFIPSPCVCHSILRRLELLKSRDQVYLTETDFLSMTDFDEVLFPMDNILDFEVTLTKGWSEKESFLLLKVYLKDPVSIKTQTDILEALDKLPVLRNAFQNDLLKVMPMLVIGNDLMVRKSTAKRLIHDKRGSA